MRHFVVLGFTSNSKNDPGKSLYLGTDRQKAVDKVNEQSGKYLRRELYDLAVPHIKRHTPGKSGKPESIPPAEAERRSTQGEEGAEETAAEEAAVDETEAQAGEDE
jgi:hypothetical protein